MNADLALTVATDRTIRLTDQGGLVLRSWTGDHVQWRDLDDFEAQLIRLHNDIQRLRRVEDIMCSDSRCRILAHPNHPNGHVLHGDTWPDKNERRDAAVSARCG